MKIDVDILKLILNNSLEDACKELNTLFWPKWHPISIAPTVNPESPVTRLYVWGPDERAHIYYWNHTRYQWPEYVQDMKEQGYRFSYWMYIGDMQGPEWGGMSEYCCCPVPVPDHQYCDNCGRVITDAQMERLGIKYVLCDVCSGAGQVSDSHGCLKCNGEGWIRENNDCQTD